VVDHGGEPLIEALALVAPGTPLRDGLDRILQAKRGALVVVGDDPVVLSICTGGFLLDAEFSPQRLSELAKMDGAIILASDTSRIARANVHLVPRASIPTSETGTRHRTAERVARSIDVPVVTVSEAMATVTVYRHARKHTLQRTGRLVDRATQAVSTVQRFKTRFDFALSTLSTLEVEDAVSVRDVVAVLQPGEMVVRIAEEIEGYLVELGEDGRLIRLQLEELGAGLDEALRLVVLDYVVARPAPRSARPASDGRADGRSGREQAAQRALDALHALTPEQLLDHGHVAAALGLGSDALGLDAGVEARGYRLLHQLPRVSDAIVERIVDRFTTLPRIMQASLGELEQVGGVGEAKARSVKHGLARLAEASILERYQ
jgi:diadenylate cyclase